MVYNAEKIGAAQRQGQARASGRVTFMQHCIFYVTSYQSRAAARGGGKPRSGAQPIREHAHNLCEHAAQRACDNMSH
jgi:hypothetical protein